MQSRLLKKTVEYTMALSTVTHFLLLLYHLKRTPPLEKQVNSMEQVKVTAEKAEKCRIHTANE